MPTPAERKALLFLSGLLCLGLVVRAAGAVRREPPPAESRAALARQLEAVDSARKAGKSRARGTRSRRAGRGSVISAREGSPGTAASAGHPPPTPALLPPAAARVGVSAASEPVDVDTASAATLERLPRIGAALARRIVEERERNGPYGSLEGLQRVRGVGPAMARALSGSVTFSGTPRLSGAATAPRRPRRRG